MTIIELEEQCPECGAGIGELHEEGCDVERCPRCGRQWISCTCPEQDMHGYRWIPWTGEWPGEADARELGWYSRRGEKRGWVRCNQDDPGASPDLNRLYEECVWNPYTQKWCLPEKLGPHPLEVVEVQRNYIHNLENTVDNVLAVMNWMVERLSPALCDTADLKEIHSRLVDITDDSKRHQAELKELEQS